MKSASSTDPTCSSTRRRSTGCGHAMNAETRRPGDANSARALCVKITSHITCQEIALYARNATRSGHRDTASGRSTREGPDRHAGRKTATRIGWGESEAQRGTEYATCVMTRGHGTIPATAVEHARGWYASSIGEKELVNQLESTITSAYVVG